MSSLYRTLKSYVAWKRSRLLARALVRLLAADLVALVALCVLDNLLGWSVSARTAVAAAFWCAQALCLASLVRDLRRQNQSDRGNARELEDTLGIRDNALVNAVCFDKQAALPPGFREHFLAEADARTAGQRLPALRSDGLLRKLLKGLLWCAAAALLYGVVCPRLAANALLRLLRPRAEVSALNFIRFELTPPGADVPYGSRLVVQGRAWKDGQPLTDVRLRVREGRGPAALYTLEGGGQHAFEAVTGELRCALVCRGEESREYRIRPVRPPLPKTFAVEISPPAYTGEAARTIDLKRDKLPPVLVGSALRFTADDGGDLRLEGFGGAPAALPLETTAAATTTLVARRPYGTDSLLAECWRAELRVTPDRIPEIRFLNQKTHLQAGYGETIDLHLSAGDDIGVVRVEVVLSCGRRSGIFRRYDYGAPGQKALREALQLTLTPEMFSQDEPLEVRAVAWDGAGQRGETASAIVVHFADLTELLKGKDGTRGGLCYGKLMEALKLQQTQRDYVAARTKDFSQRDATALAGPQQRVEELIAGALREAQEMKLPEAFQKQLQNLREHDAKALTASARDLQRQAKPDAVRVNEIVLRQTALISRLQGLLGMAGAQERSRLEERARQQEIEADKELYDAMRRLQEKVQRFAEEEKRLKAETEALDPKRTDDFSEEEEKLLGDLAARQDELADFLKTAFSDLSKLGAQDFSNSSMADEFSEIFEELQRAGEALKAKHIEVATLAEDTACDSAEAVSANIERWLADAKDYIKWNAEEDGLTQDTDLTDLPDELTDIIGDLIEEEGEEDEDEVQDSTNSFTYDTDAGLGWGVMDGNISSMQAKGITGNVLPNKNEVGGRSGEGRSGRSSGQYVEKEAYGKGGRKTPTRLTDSPFERGTVEDHSQDPQGGATGGGKQSGIGGEGLVGQTPDQDTGSGLRTNAHFAELRQRTEAALHRLAERQLPVGELSEALEKLREAEQLGEGGGVDARALGQGAARSLQNARAAVLAAERAQLDERRRGALESLPAASASHNEKVPDAYESLVGAYFKAIAGSRGKPKGDDSNVPK